MKLEKIPLKRWKKDEVGAWALHLTSKKHKERDSVTLKENGEEIIVRWWKHFAGGYTVYTKKDPEFAELRALLERIKRYHGEK